MATRWVLGGVVGCCALILLFGGLCEGNAFGELGKLALLIM